MSDADFEAQVMQLWRKHIITRRWKPGFATGSWLECVCGWRSPSTVPMTISDTRAVESAHVAELASEIHRQLLRRSEAADV